MIRLFLLMAIIFLMVLFVRELKRYLARDHKIEELNETLLEGELVDIDKEISTERSRQNGVESEIKDINSNNKFDKEENNND